MDDLKIGIIGLDTSHAIAFTKLLHNPGERDYVSGGKVVMAYPGGSPDFELSISRVDGFTKQMQADFGIEIVDSVEQLAFQCDAILLESADGRKHLEQLREVVPFRKPVFIDKPFCLRSEDANEMVQLAATYQTPIMSSSALRFAEDLQKVLAITEKGEIIGADCFGPMELQETQPGYFWYGIHAIEMLFTILGGGAKEVRSVANADHDFITAKWKDGRIGTVRGNRKGNYQFGALIHFEHGTEFVDIRADSKPFYASLLEQIISFFHRGTSKVPVSETLEIIRFIEAANASRRSGGAIEVGR